MKLFVDDERNPPDDTWTVARTYKHAVFLLSVAVNAGETITELSLDHDLGEEDIDATGYGIACRVEEAQYEGMSIPDVITCHSANPVGRARIEQVIAQINKRRQKC